MWGCEEVQVAVNEAGYKILQTYELHHFEETIQFNRQTGKEIIKINKFWNSVFVLKPFFSV